MYGGPDEAAGWTAWGAAAAIGLLGLVLALPLALRPVDPGRAAAIFPPWWDRAQALAATARAGRIVALGAAPFVVFARSDGRPLAPGLTAQGAVLVIDPGLAAACGSRIYNVQND